MYLYARRFVWDDPSPENNAEVKAVAKLLCNDVHPQRVKYIIERCGYWRKVNWLHGWFVDNIQEGVDNCKEAYIKRDQLRGLLNSVEQALKTGDHSMFTPRQGFFFGSENMSEEEWKEDLQQTADILNACFNDYSKDWEFYYQSSW